ncbi:MAG: hypothetical protein ABJE66_00095 [Deltaproteobacteria bacterium]
MRVALALLFVAGTAVADPDVKQQLPDDAIATLDGCWCVRGEKETWTFKPNADHGLDVVRELDRDAVESPRARIARPVMFSTKNHDFTFAATSRIHGSMAIFKIDGATLQTSWFSTHDGRSYFFTGTNVVVVRCKD